MKMNNKLSKTNWIVCIFILALPLSWASFVVGSVYRNLTIILLGAFLVLNYDKPLHLNSSKTFSAWTTFFVYVVLTGTWSKNSNIALSNMLGFILLYIVAFVFVFSNFGKGESIYIDYSWIFVGIAFSMLFIFGSRGVVSEHTARETLYVLGNVVDPNEFAGVFSVSISLSINYLFESEKKVFKIVKHSSYLQSNNQLLKILQTIHPIQRLL